MGTNLQKLYLFNSYTNKLEEFTTINENIAKIYLCGPTVYGLAHIGHARSSITFDIINRYLTYLGYKVKFIRNYTDVGHLEYDADEGDDKIQKQAIKEQIDPMEIVQKYINYYRKDMDLLNIISPNVEPQASSYINKQIENIQIILNKGYAYEINGSVYFDIKKYNEVFKTYGIISKRNINEVINETRELNNQDEKKNNIDFALWKKADNKHIMKWNSPWGYGYPGWHTECVALSTEFLGTLFDIHGGGYDLKFPHHECELAQNKVINNTQLANFWIHNNLVNIDGKKMSKSLNNYITLEDLFFNNNNILNQTFKPMDLRFLILQSHYRSILSLTTNGLESAHKGYIKLINAVKYIKSIEYPESEHADINSEIENTIQNTIQKIFNELNNDLNTPEVIANLFDLVKIINNIKNSAIQLSNIHKNTFVNLKKTYINVVENILGLQEPKIDKKSIKIILEIYKNAKLKTDYATIDTIREKINTIGIRICDSKTDIDYEYI